MLSFKIPTKGFVQNGQFPFLEAGKSAIPDRPEAQNSLSTSLGLAEV